jgi:flavin reductase (DIM6/NTAB) family NADH-FMN oxidoreductase RutF
MSNPGSPLQDKFKEAMAHVATPVAVVSSVDGTLPVGTTVSAFTALSMNPPMVLVSLDRDSATLERVMLSKRFGVNILASDQQSTAVKFAGKGGVGKFQGVSWELRSNRC